MVAMGLRQCHDLHLRYSLAFGLFDYDNTDTSEYSRFDFRYPCKKLFRFLVHTYDDVVRAICVSQMIGLELELMGFFIKVLFEAIGQTDGEGKIIVHKNKNRHIVI